MTVSPSSIAPTVEEKLDVQPRSPHQPVQLRRRHARNIVERAAFHPAPAAAVEPDGVIDHFRRLPLVPVICREQLDPPSGRFEAAEQGAVGTRE